MIKVFQYFFKLKREIEFEKAALVGILILAVFLRFWQITKLPVGFNADEAALGYNAYSILKTGRDEFGEWFPVAFTSFGDYKPPLYVYLTVPFVLIFGLSEFAVRAPSALFGVMTVILVYFISLKLFNNRTIGLISSLFVSLSPWHVHYSRGGWETNIFTFLLSLGIYFLVMSINNSKFLYLSAIVFGFSFYSYQGARLVAPLIALALFLIYREKLLLIKKHLILSILLAVIIVAPSLPTFIRGTAFSRFSGVSIFADSGPFWGVNELRGEHENHNSFFIRLLHNRAQAYGTVFIRNVLYHFDGNFLFISGDQIPRNRVVNHGTLLLFYAPFLILGSLLIIRKENCWLVLLSWAFLASVASALTFQSPQALRAASMVVPLGIVTGYGFYNFINILNKFSRLISLTIKSVLAAVLVLSVVNFWHFYLIHNPREIPHAFQPGFSELVPYLFQRKSDFDKVVVTDFYDQPYILFLFYSKYDPRRFWPEAVLTPRDKFGFSTVRKFDKFEFRKIDWQFDSKLKNSLVVAAPQEMPNHLDASAKIDKIVYFPDNITPALFVIRVD